MIKRIATLTLLLVYFTVTTGFTMSAHFCGGQITKVSVTSKKLYCGEKEMEMKCCHNKHVDVKVSDKHQTLSNDVNLQVPAPALIAVLFRPFLSVQDLAIKGVPYDYKGPPLLSAIPLTISNSVFRI